MRLIWVKRPGILDFNGQSISGDEGMRMSTIALYMQMNGSITGRREGLRWLRLPRKRLDTLGMVPGGRHLSRGGLRIASTAVRGKAGRQPESSHASGGFAG
jgi:hypothetical protein